MSTTMGNTTYYYGPNGAPAGSATTMGRQRDVGERRRLAVSDQLVPQVLQGHGRNALVLQLAENCETRIVLSGAVPITKRKERQ